MVVLVLALIPVVAVATAWFVVPVWAWVLVMVLLIAFVLLAGQRITGQWLGVLIDERNKASISRFQTILWTVLVVAALLVSGITNVRLKTDNPLDIAVPAELWILLGISVTSLVGAGLIKQDKTKTEPELQTAQIALRKAENMEADRIWRVGNSLVTGDAAAPKVMAEGVLTVNTGPEQASWLDLLRAEEVGNVGRLDIGKIQILYFTVILLVAYGAAVASLLHGHAETAIDKFPSLSESMLALLGISHAAYLANKAVLRTPTT